MTVASRWARACAVWSLALALPAMVLAGGDPTPLLFDLNTEPPDASDVLEPTSGVAVGAHALFHHCAVADGCELWSFGGGGPVFRIVRDLRSGTGSSWPQCFLAAGDVAFFVARPSPYVGSDLWFTDGTSSGTWSVGAARTTEPPDGYLGSCPRGSPSPGVVVAVLEIDGVSGLWGLDATGGPELLHALTPSELFPQTNGELLIAAAGAVYFTLCADGSGCEPWISEGSAAGTGPLADLVPDIGGSDAVGYASYAGAVHFLAQLPDGPSLWRVDPSTLAVERIDVLPALPPGTGIGRGAASAAHYFFTLEPPGAASELWAYDGIAATRVVPAPDVTVPTHEGLGGLLGVESGLFFWLEDGAGTRPWFSAGTAATTTPLADVTVEAPTSGEGPFHRAGARVAFAGWREEDGSEPWASDGTPGATAPLGDLVPGPQGSGPRGWIEQGDDLLFLTSLAEPAIGLWRVTATGVSQEATLAPPNGSSMPIPAGVRDGRALVVATDSPLGRSLLAATLAPDGGVDTLVAGGPAPYFAQFHELGELGGRHWFGHQLQSDLPLDWIRTDTTPAGTSTLEGVEFEPFAEPGTSARVPGGLLLRICQDATGCEPWRLEPAGAAELVRDVHSGPEDGFDGAVAGMTGGAIFAGSDLASGTEPWFTDGTLAATFRLDDVLAGPASSAARRFAALPTALLFTGWTGGGFLARSLFLLADSVGPAVEVTPLASGFAPELYPFATASSGDEVGFFLHSSSGDPGLWLSDGTLGGTRPLVSPLGDTSAAPFADLAYFGGLWFFLDADPAHGRELWVSDGTAVGTHLVADLYPGPASSNPRELTAGGSGIFFTAVSPDSGSELWWTDGIEPPEQVVDLEPGPGGTAPSQLRFERDYLCWRFSSLELGTELACLYDPGEAIFADDFEVGDTLDWDHSD